MSDKPNILLITSDQQHWNTLGCLNPEIKTPNLDKLAADGTLFTRAYSPNPTCTPTRASIITGKYPSQHGAYSLGTKLPEDEPVVGDIFREAGYRTSLIGKAHFQPLKSTDEFPSVEAYPVLQDLEFWRRYNEDFYGFEHVELARNHGHEAHVGQHYALWMEEKGLTNWRDYFRPPTGNRKSRSRSWEIPEEYHYNNWIAERTNAMLDEYAGKNENFFLWTSFFDPHPPYLVPEGWDTMYDPEKITVPRSMEGEHEGNPPHFQLTQEEEPDFSPWKEESGNTMHGFHSHLHDRETLARNIAVYYGMVSCMDKYIGRILDHLEKLGQRENTLVVFTTDHGHLFGQHGLVAKGAFHYEDLIRVPFIVSMPGSLPRNKKNPALQSLVDLPQTFLSICGIDNPEPMTGVNQKDVWFGQCPKQRDHVIVENRHQPTSIHVKTYVDERCKFTAYYQKDCGEMFDLVDDPGETNNLWDNPNCQDLKIELLEKLLTAEIEKEEPLDDEKLRKPYKNRECQVKTVNTESYAIVFNPPARRYELFDLGNDPRRNHNLWTETNYKSVKTEMLWQLLFERMGNEPLWMPRIAGA